MRRFGFSLLAIVIGWFFISVVMALAQTPAHPAEHKSTASSGNAAALEIRDGERLFHVHCGRCHNPPEDLSPREASAVVRQMKVRANLSDKDEQALLKFLAP